jgi:hypothetical protein
MCRAGQLLALVLLAAGVPALQGADSFPFPVAPGYDPRNPHVDAQSCVSRPGGGNCTNFMRASPLLRHPDQHLDTCFNTSAHTVIDFSPKSHFGTYAYWHRIMDGFLPVYDLVERAAAELNASGTPPLLLAPLDFQALLEFFLPAADVTYYDSWRFRVVGSAGEESRNEHTNDVEKLCINVPGGEVRLHYHEPVFHPWVNGYKRDALKLRAPPMQTRAHELLEHNGLLFSRGLHMKTILFIHREAGKERAWADSDGVVRELLAHLPGYQLAFYFGNESLTETITLFANAAVVYAFHGAGLINVLFCRPSTLVIEVTTFRNTNVTALWRTNAAIDEIHGRLIWVNSHIPLGLFNLDVGLSDVDTDLQVKAHRHIPMPKEQIADAASLIKSLHKFRCARRLRRLCF